MYGLNLEKIERYLYMTDVKSFISLNEKEIESVSETRNMECKPESSTEADIKYKIRLVRENLDKKISQKQLATAIGVTQAHVSQIENGERKPSEEVLNKICEFLEVRNSDLVYDEFDAFKDSLINLLGKIEIRKWKNEIAAGDAIETLINAVNGIQYK